MIKAGEFLIVGFNGYEISKQLEKLITQHNLFGVILFSRNFNSSKQLRLLCNRLQKIKSKVSNNPLLIGCDYEGGFVCRFNKAIHPIPAPYAQTLSKNPDYTYKLYNYNAHALKKFGFNVNFAPVLDILPKNNYSPIGIRSLGHDIKTINNFSYKAIKGMHDNAILACGKHYPGLGFAKYDAHFELPIIKTSKKNILENHIAPYKYLIRKDLSLIMSSHAYYNKINKSLIPSTFSFEINKTILRDNLKFNGLLISDDLNMNAIKNKWTLEDASILSLKSGIDIIMICHELKKIPSVLNKIDIAIKNKTISPEFIKENLKRKKLIYKKLKSFPTNKKESLSLKEINNISKNIASSAFKIIKYNNFLISRQNKVMLIISDEIKKGYIEETLSFKNFYEKLKNIFTNIEFVYLKDFIKLNKKNILNVENLFIILSNISINDVKLLKAKLENIKNIDLGICINNYYIAKSINSICKSIILSHGFLKDNRKLIINYIKNLL